MALMDIPAYALGDQELWTPKLVKEALVEAFLVCERTVSRAGPKASKSAWGLIYDLDDVWEQRENPSAIALAAKAGNRRITAALISRSEFVLHGGKAPQGQMQPWLRGPLAGTQMRDKLELWVLHEVGKEIGYTKRTLQQQCEARGWALSSFNRDVTRAAGVIAQRLSSAGVIVW